MLSTWSTATCTARHKERTEQSTLRVQIGRLTGVAVAEAAFEDAAAEHVHHVADDDGFGRARQRVAAVFAARRFDETGLAQDAQDLGRVGGETPSAWLISGIVRLPPSPA